MKRAVGFILGVLYIPTMIVAGFGLASLILHTGALNMEFEHTEQPDGYAVLDPISAVTLLYCWGEEGNVAGGPDAPAPTHAVYARPGEPATFGSIDVGLRMWTDPKHNPGTLYAVCY